MSFVEGISTVSVDVADPAFAICVSSAVLLVGLLLAIPAVATTLQLPHLQRAIGKLLGHLRATLDRSKKG